MSAERIRQIEAKAMQMMKGRVGAIRGGALKARPTLSSWRQAPHGKLGFIHILPVRP